MPAFVEQSGKIALTVLFTRVTLYIKSIFFNVKKYLNITNIFFSNKKQKLNRFKINSI
jgi:hypothetical protein